MTSLLLEPSVAPRIFHLPPGEVSSASALDAVRTAESTGLILDEWQRLSIEAMLAERPDGLWAAFEAGVVVARQNGKGGVLECRALAGLFVFGDRMVLWTAHEFKTCKAAYERLRDLIQSTPDLERRVAHWKFSNQEVSIELHDGRKIQFIARSQKSGRGLTADCLILDEAMYLTATHLAALMPTLSTSANPQIVFAGSAGLSTSIVWWALRKRALSGDGGRLAWCEWTAEDIRFNDKNELVSVPPAPNDPVAWRAANPAMSVGRITEEFIAAEMRALESDIAQFLRERMGVWDPLPADEGHDRIVSKEEWKQAGDTITADNPLPSVGRRCLAWDVSDARSSVGWVGERADGVFHGEIVESKAGTDWVAERLATYAENSGGLVIGLAYVAGAPGEALVLDVIAACKAKGIVLEPKVNLFKMSGQAYSAACVDWYNKTTDGTLRHVNDPLLTNAVDGAVWRDTGESRVFDRKNATAEISPLVLTVAALRGLQVAPEPEPDAVPMFAYTS